MHSQRALHTSLLLLAGLLAFTAVASATVTLEPGTDRLGAVFKAFALDQADPQLCRQACDADATCQAYTYAKPGVKGAQAMCFLKNSAPPATPNDCCTSGARTVGINIPPLMKFPPKLKTLVPGPGSAPKVPVVNIPADIPPAKRMELSGGKSDALWAHLAPNHMLEPGRGLISFTGPSDVWGGSGSATEPNMVAFTTNSDEHVAELHLRLQPGAAKLLVVDCKVSNDNDDVVYVVSELFGPEQLYNQLIDGHLLFMVNATGLAFITVSADHPWNFYSCDIRTP
jgi:hypothetical protein